MSYHLLWSGVGGQLLSYHSYHLLWSGVGGQLLSYHSYHLLWSRVGGQLLSYHLLWSGVGGQLLSYHLLWSGVGGQLLSYHVGGLYCTSFWDPFAELSGIQARTRERETIALPERGKLEELAMAPLPAPQKGNRNCNMLIFEKNKITEYVHLSECFMGQNCFHILAM